MREIKDNTKLDSFMKLFNSLTKTIEEIEPIHDKKIGFYTCGPTVYHFATIGNFRTYTNADLLLRALKFSGLSVRYVMNITDVGHLTGDNEGDADTGEDRMEKSAKKEGKTAWEVAEFYTEVFLSDFEKLHLTKPNVIAKATDHIKEQIELVKKLEQKGYTYETSDGIYFDTTKFKDYGQLSSLDEIKEGARVEINPEKRDPRDFALWKFSPKDEKRQMEWDSPWGIGFPGWHIECSAMSMKYLGESFELHAGGMDLKETHHPNEIAQSEAATGKQFVKYWMHGAFVLVNGEKMSKSRGNAYRLYDLEKENYDPLALRYLYMQTHYRQEMNFTFASLDAATNALKHLKDVMLTWNSPTEVSKGYTLSFMEALSEDLNMPQALAVIWEMTKADIPSGQKTATLIKFDQVLGFGLEEFYTEESKKRLDAVPEEVRILVKERERLRKQRQYHLADQMRNQIEKLGYIVTDSDNGSEIRKI